MTAPVILPYRGVLPTIDATAFVAPNTSVIGDVRVGPESSVWFGTTLRGDVQPIVIGARTSIQDNSVIHATDGWTPTIVGDDCVVGHRVILQRLGIVRIAEPPEADHEVCPISKVQDELPLLRERLVLEE